MAKPCFLMHPLLDTETAILRSQTYSAIGNHRKSPGFPEYDVTINVRANDFREDARTT